MHYGSSKDGTLAATIPHAQRHTIAGDLPAAIVPKLAAFFATHVRQQSPA